MARVMTKKLGRQRRRKHIRKTVRGTAERPRLTVFRSARHIYAQLVDDDAGHTVASASSLSPDLKKVTGGNKDGAAAVGKALGDLARNKDIQKVVFDRNGYKYHGRVAALAEAAREAGLEF